MKFFTKLLVMLFLLVTAFLVGMVSPGQWLTDRQGEAQKMYNRIRFSKNPVAEKFVGTPFDLKIVYVPSTEGTLETYLVNSDKKEMLPILEVEGTTQVGDSGHRLKGIGEEGRNKLKTILDSARDGSTTTMDKVLDFLGQ